MTIKKHFLTYLTATLIGVSCLMGTSAMAAPSYNLQMLPTNLKELLKQEGRNKLMKYAGEWIEAANNVIGTLRSLTEPFIIPEVNSVTNPKDWISYVPKNVEPLLKAEEKNIDDIHKANDQGLINVYVDEVEEPDIDKVQEEVSKVVFLNNDTPETSKLSRKQQDLLVLKVATNAYGVANKSLELSQNALKERQEWHDRWFGKDGQEGEIRANDHIAAWHFISLMQSVHRRRIRELLYLQSLHLELHTALGLVNQEKPIDTSSMKLTEPATTDGATPPTQQNTQSGTTGTTPAQSAQ